jgi:hypothetical protein
VLSDIPTPFLVVFCLVLALVVAGFVVTFVGIAKGRRTLLDAGIDPLTAQAQLAAKLMNSELLSPAHTLEQRLAELDDLHRRGVISDEEHRTARAKALADG